MEILATIICATKRFHIEIYLISLIAVASFKYAKRCDPNAEAAEGVLHRGSCQKDGADGVERDRGGR